MKKQESKINQTTGYMTALNPFRHYHVHHNAKCIVCEAIEPHMIRVGSVIFCDNHAQSEFKSDDPVHKEHVTYLKWLHKSWEMQNEDDKD